MSKLLDKNKSVVSMISQIIESRFLTITCPLLYSLNLCFMMKGLGAQLFVRYYSSGAVGQQVINLPMFTSGLGYCLCSFMVEEEINCWDQIVGGQASSLEDFRPWMVCG